MSGLAEGDATSPLPELVLEPSPAGGHQAQVARAAATICEAAQVAAAVVQRLRAVYRAAGEGGERMGPVDLSDLVTQAVAFTHPRWRDQALARGATIA